jgi:hypothetical protein
MLSVAAFSGRYAQAFPSFGSELAENLHGVLSHDDKGIRLREPVLAPEH